MVSAADIGWFAQQYLCCFNAGAQQSVIFLLLLIRRRNDKLLAYRLSKLGTNTLMMAESPLEDRPKFATLPIRCRLKPSTIPGQYIALIGANQSGHSDSEYLTTTMFPTLSRLLLRSSALPDRHLLQSQAGLHKKRPASAIRKIRSLLRWVSY